MKGPQPMVFLAILILLLVMIGLESDSIKTAAQLPRHY